MFKAFLLVIAIIIFAVLSVLCFVFAIIYFVNSKKGKFGWLGGLLFSISGLIFSIYFTVNTAVNKAKGFAHKMEESFIRNIDTAAYRNYNFADSLKSEQIKYLKLSEPAKYKGTVPDQFYNYLGFKDYYRLPLIYPFSLHCTDVLDNGSLFDEADVLKFNENDNGERECNITNITTFTFDKNILLAKQSYNDKLQESNTYLIYHFSTGKSENLKTFDELVSRAKTLGYSRPVKLYSCDRYYKLF